jgi:C_GCAxxG_C_C family probable redox protein
MRFGLDRVIALKVSGAFGSGMGMGETCGAVTGAFMIIGLKHGKTKADDDVARETTYILVKELTVRFLAQNGSIKCKDLLGHDVNTPEGMDAVIDKKLFITFCPKFVQDAAEITQEILKD